MTSNSECTTPTVAPAPGAGASRGTWGRNGIALVALVAGLLGGWLLQDGGAVQLHAVEARHTIKEGEQPYSYVPFRRNLWVIRHDAGSAQFFIFPTAEEKPIQPSKTFTIDRELFPRNQVIYQASDHNLTNFLWILNPVTGKAMYLKAMRDGKVEPSQLLEVEGG